MGDGVHQECHPICKIVMRYEILVFMHYTLKNKATFSNVNKHPLNYKLPMQSRNLPHELMR